MRRCAILVLLLAGLLLTGRVSAGCAVSSRTMWHDVSGAATLDDAIAKAEAHPSAFAVAPELLAEGYRRGAFWLRLSLRCDLTDGAPLLRLPPTFLDHVDVYQRDADGSWRVERRGDRALAIPLRDATPRVALLPTALGSAPATVYVRMQTTSTAVLRVQAVGEQAAQQLDARDAAALGAYVGVLLTVLAWAVLAVHPREAPLVPSFAAFQLVGAATMLAQTGWLGVIAPALAAHQHTLGSLGVFASTATGMRFCQRLACPAATTGAMRHGPWIVMAWMAACAAMFVAGFPLAALAGGQVGVVLAGLWCLQQAARPPADDGAVPDTLRRAAFALVGLAALVTAGRHLGAWRLGATGAYSPLLNYGSNALLMFSLLLARDRHGRAQARLLRRQLAAEQALTAQRAHQLEAKSQLVGLLAHELSSPLTVLQFAVDGGAAPQAEAARDALRDIALLIERTVQIDRLDDAGWTPGTTRRLALAPWLAELTAATHAASREPALRPPPRCQVAQDLVVETDELLLRIIVGNLLDNALRHGDPSRPVTIVAEADPPAGLRLRIGNAPGPRGRPDADVLFERYYRGSPASRVRGCGLGLGLWLSRSLARRLGGELRLLPADADTPDASDIVLELCLPSTPPR